MGCAVVRDELIEVLYDEASRETARRVAEHLALCGPCRDEMEAFRSVRRDLAKWTLPVSGRGPVARRRASFWLAAAALLLLSAGAALGLSGSELSYQDGHFAFRIGAGPDAEELVAAAEARHNMEMAELRASLGSAASDRGGRDIVEKVEALILESEARQAERLEAGLRDLQQQTEAQRRYDLARVSAGLSYLDGRSGQHVARTSELMGYVLQAAENK